MRTGLLAGWILLVATASAEAGVDEPRRLIIGLSPPLPGQATQAARARIRQEGPPQGVRTLRAFRHVPFMLVEADVRGQGWLQRRPEVTSIREDLAEPPLLDVSTAQIGAPTAWANGNDGSGWAVAVLDTGLDAAHAWFSAPGKLLAEACFSSDSANSESLCPGGVEESLAAGSSAHCSDNTPNCHHGTHVSGIAVGHPGTGDLHGVARGAPLISIQVFSRFDAASCGAAGAGCLKSYVSDQVAALEHILDLAQTMNIASVNLSLGGGFYTDVAECDTEFEARKAAVDALAEAGIAVIAASGNSSLKNGTTAPACISSVISVGSVTSSDSVTSTSNVGPYLDFLAPGENIDSAVPDGGTLPYSGTSMAAPHLSGAWAVLRQKAPLASMEQLYDALVLTATPVDDLRSGGIETGLPRINLDAALAEFPDTLPEFESDPPAGSLLDHGVVYLGKTSGLMAIEVSNTGADPLSLSCTVTGAHSESFEVTGCAGPLVPSGSVLLQTACTPTRAGALEAQLAVTHNDSDENPTVFNLACSGYDDVLFESGFE